MKGIDVDECMVSVGNTEVNERLCTPQNYGANTWHKLHNRRARQRKPADTKKPR